MAPTHEWGELGTENDSSQGSVQQFASEMDALRNMKTRSLKPIHEGTHSINSSPSIGDVSPPLAKMPGLASAYGGGKGSGKQGHGAGAPVNPSSGYNPPARSSTGGKGGGKKNFVTEDEFPDVPPEPGTGQAEDMIT